MGGETEHAICACETVSHSELGPVKNHERLGRVVTSPNHIKADGTIKPSLFPPTHLIGSGLSLLRVDEMSAEEIERQVLAIAGTKPGETPKGLRLCVTQRIRDLHDENRGHRALCVVDDPVIGHPKLPDNPAHAIVIRSAEQSLADAIQLRGLLADLFSPLTPVNQVHKGSSEASA